MPELIADLPLDDRPREKLRRHGPQTLSDAELLAILLGSGTRGKNAIQLAREILIDGLGALGRSPVEALARTHGVGAAKATRIKAAFEIASRIAASDPNDTPRYDDAVTGRALMSRYAHESQEHLGAVLLDARQHVLKQCEIFVGTVTRALVSSRDVVRVALEVNAVGVVLFHNHPSGDPAPSRADVELTQRLRQVGDLCGIPVLDHVVVGWEGYTSLAERNWR